MRAPEYVRGAAIYCARPIFWQFLAHETSTPISTPAEAAIALRKKLAITSRRELETSERAAAEYRVLITRFNDHLRSMSRGQQ